MPRCGATFDEKSVPPWTRGDFRGVLNAGTNPHRRGVPLSRWFDPSPTSTAHQLPPPWPLAPASPPRLRRGAYFGAPRGFRIMKPLIFVIGKGAFHDSTN